jgi:hypothetical protein
MPACILDRFACLHVLHLVLTYMFMRCIIACMSARVREKTLIIKKSSYVFASSGFWENPWKS